ncbi:MAG TPA: cysteine synthase family protein [Candidatus Eisenbacteria bacterium]|nr:cysteine synthase family protein [Candidatus Eisenbacteria bacterium]
MRMDAAPQSPLLERIGHTPLLEIEGVYVKLECANPSGSVKDRIARHMVLQAIQRGELVRGMTIVETTSGNTGIALAMVARELGFPLLIFMPEHMSPERREMMKRLGAVVRLTAREEGFPGAIRARDAYKSRRGFWVPDQFANPDNPACHRATTAREILEQLRDHGSPRIDYFVAGVGTGGTLMGVGEALRERMPDMKIVAVEPMESNALCGGPAGDHGIMGIGDGFVPELIDLARIHEVRTVSTAQALDTARRIRGRYGFCVGISSGANMRIALRLRTGPANVLTLWPDSADRYASSGLSPAAEGLRCALQPFCQARAQALLSKPE